ncbi:hypothetical protein D3C84_507030 [compost metagenome]
MQLDPARLHGFVGDGDGDDLLALQVAHVTDGVGQADTALPGDKAIEGGHVIALQRHIERQALHTTADVEQAPGSGIAGGQGNGVGLHVSQFDHGPVGQRMLRRDHGHDAARQRALDIDFPLRGQAVGQPQVGSPFAHPFGHFIGRNHIEGKQDAFVDLAKTGNGIRQEIDSEALRAGHAHIAATQAMQFAQLFDQLHGLHLGLACIRGDLFPRCGRQHAPGAAFEQRSAQFVFELGDLPTDRGRGHVQPGRGFVDRSTADHFKKIAQGYGLHAVELHQPHLCLYSNASC